MNIKKILLVEDEKIAREGVRDFLISRGWGRGSEKVLRVRAECI